MIGVQLHLCWGLPLVNLDSVESGEEACYKRVHLGFGMRIDELDSGISVLLWDLSPK